MWPQGTNGGATHLALGETAPLSVTRRATLSGGRVELGSSLIRTREFAEQRDPTVRGKRLRARIYALDEDQAMELRTTPEFAGEELTDPEISRLVGIYRTTVTRVLRFAA
jgi:hypothetical protein